MSVCLVFVLFSKSPHKIFPRGVVTDHSPQDPHSAHVAHMHVERAKRADEVSGQIKDADQNYTRSEDQPIPTLGLKKSENPQNQGAT